MAVLESKIDKFISKIELGSSFFEEAGHLLVQMVDEDPHVFEEILKLRRVDWLTRDVLATFEAIGRKKIAVQALFLPKHVIDRIVGLPLEEQVRIATQPVHVYVGHEGKRRKTDAKPAARLSSREAKLAISPTGLRTPEEQERITELNRKPKSFRAVGTFELTVMNGKPFLRQHQGSGQPQRIELGPGGTAIVQIFREE